MKTILKLFAASTIIATTVSCTDVGWEKMTNYMQSFHVKCYSAGVVIYEGYSTGRLENETHSDGWAFVDKATRKFTRVGGDCVIQE